MESPIKISGNSCLVPVSRILFAITKNIEKKAKSVTNINICFFLHNIRVYHRRIGFGQRYR